MSPRHLLWVTLVAAGCSADAAYKDTSGGYGDYASDSAPSSSTGTTSTTDPNTKPGGENEDDYLAMLPAQTDVYVFIANPTRNTITRVNVDTLEVRTAEVGSDPQIVLTTPDYRTAVCFNRGSDSVSLVDAASLGRVDVPVRDNFNQMKLSPDGRWAVLWHDQAAERPDDPPAEGSQSFNEVSFVDVENAIHYPMAVGYNPRDVVFTDNSGTAVVVADEVLALVDLTADNPFPELIQIADDLIDPPIAEEAVVAPDGSYAFVRQFGATDVLVVDLGSHAVDAVPVGDNPTDLDLTPDGKNAVVITRDSAQLWWLDVADPLAAPIVLDLPPSGYGSITFAPTGDLAILYTTATLLDRYATWVPGSAQIVERALVKPVSGLSITPTGESMLVFHTLGDAPNADANSPFYGNYALTTIALADFRSNPLLLPTEITGYANSNNGHFGYFIMDQTPLLEVLDYSTLLNDEIPLSSDPVFVGALPDLDLTDDDEPAAWVSQDHPLGRITFYDPDDGTTDTITGFELNSQIEGE